MESHDWSLNKVKVSRLRRKKQLTADRVALTRRRDINAPALKTGGGGGGGGKTS